MSNAFFLQDSFSPDHLRNLTVNAGVRLELQKIYDNNGNGVFSTDNLAPRVSADLRPVQRRPLEDLGLLRPLLRGGPAGRPGPLLRRRELRDRVSATSARAPGAASSQSNWVGAGEYSKCGRPDNAFATFNSAYAQPNMQGQYHNEIVATVERQVMEDMTVRLDYQHRWLGNIIEDGYGPHGNSVLANPGNVPDSAIIAGQQPAGPGARRIATANPTDAGRAGELSRTPRPT